MILDHRFKPAFIQDFTLNIVFLLSGFPKAMATLTNVRNTSAPWFLEAASFEGHENVTLASADGQRVAINACVFASASPWCYDMLKSVPAEWDDFCVITELPLTDLMAFKRLASTGCVLGLSRDQLLAKETIQGLTLGFESLGLFNQSLDFSDSQCYPLDFVKSETKDEILYDQWENSELKFDLGDSTYHQDSSEPTEAKPPRKRKSVTTKRVPKSKNGTAIKNNGETESWVPKISEEKVESDDWTPCKKRSKKSRKKTAIGKKSQTRIQFYGLFSFPTDESLRDNSRLYQCKLCVRGFNNSMVMFEFAAFSDVV